MLNKASASSGTTSRNTGNASTFDRDTVTVVVFIFVLYFYVVSLYWTMREAGRYMRALHNVYVQKYHADEASGEERARLLGTRGESANSNRLGGAASNRRSGRFAAFGSNRSARRLSTWFRLRLAPKSSAFGTHATVTSTVRMQENYTDDMIRTIMLLTLTKTVNTKTVSTKTVSVNHNRGAELKAEREVSPARTQSQQEQQMNLVEGSHQTNMEETVEDPNVEDSNVEESGRGAAASQKNENNMTASMALVKVMQKSTGLGPDTYGKASLH